MIMTRAVSDRILKDANGDIVDHLRNHIHLTNCIHLKNHIHKHSPLSHDSHLMRDLIALQRSRSLRDPSASPPPWHSPLTTNVAPKSTEIVGATGRRRSMGTERVRDRRRLSGSSPPVQEFIETSKLGPSEMDAFTHVVRLANEENGKSVSQDNTRVKKKESVGGISSLHGDRSRRNENGIQLSQGSTSGLPEQRRKKKGPVKGKQNQESFSKTLSEQLNEVGEDSSGDKGAAYSNAHLHGRLKKHEMVFDQPEPSFHGSCTGLHRGRRRKFRRIKGTQPSAAPRGSRTQNALSVASNSSVCAMGHQNHQIQDRECEFAEHDVTGAPKNGCGIPWNWSIIHHRGKSFIDMAGRSLSCGLSDPRLKREGSAAQGGDAHDFPAASDRSSSGSKSDAEALPLLVEGFGTHETSENAAWEHDYSGELGIFADSLLKRDAGSDLASEGRSGGLQKQRRDHHGKHQSHRGMHQSLTQKYMPRTFRDLVGQNLVVQALSNAVVQRKVGFLYVFYGPHGTGKTSCARILARALNCQSSDHPKPCGFCSSCVAHDMGKSRNIKEVGPVCNLNFASTMDFLDGMMMSQQGSHYRVFIFDDCDNLSPECWSSISKVIDRAPRRVVFMLICSSLDVLPHIIISRCQKFFFPKLKDADIIYALQWISRKENLEIDKDAIKLIASRSDGSLRDAEMTLEQLSLLGQRISVTLVQELVGLISDEKLVDLLDLALSADTVNTVKCLREIMETGVEPLALMSQLATVITDILAGSYDFSKDRRRRKFFKHQASAKEDMEKLRHALKTLSEAEKQLRMSNDKLTWLTAALLQLAPDGQYTVTSSSSETSFKRSPLGLNNNLCKDIPRKSNVSHGSMPYGKNSSITADVISHPVMATVADVDRANRRKGFGQSRMETEDIWLEALEQIQIGCIKDFLYQEGKLMSVSYGVAPTVKLMFSSSQTKSKAEKFKEYILQAFESTLGCPVIIEIRSNSRKDVAGPSGPVVLPSSEDISSSQRNVNPNSIPSSWVPILEHDSTRMTQSGLRDGTTEIVEVTSSPKDQKFIRRNGQIDKRGMEIARISEAGPSNRRPQTASQLESRRSREQNQCQSIVRSKVSLAHVISQAEGRSNRSAWTKRKAVSIAEKLEQENLRLEPKSRSLLCWKASRSTRRKISHLKGRSRRSRSVLRFVSCGRCLRVKSPR